MSSILMNILILSIAFAASFLASLLGGVFAVFGSRFEKKAGQIVLAFSAGTILGLLVFDLFPEAYEASLEIHSLGWLIFLAFLLGTFFLLGGVHIIIEKFFHEKEEHQNHEHAHITHYLKIKEKSLKFAGFSLFIALFFHNFPEGMSLGITSAKQFEDGIKLAIFLGLHNFAMGISMTMPLLLIKTKKRNIFLLLLISSLPFVLGTFLGYVTPNTNSWIEVGALSFSGGILLFVLFEEILSFERKKKKELGFQILSLTIGFFLATFLHFIF